MSVDLYHPTLSPVSAELDPAKRRRIARIAAGVLAVALAGGTAYVVTGGSEPVASSPVVTAPEPAAPVVVRPGDVVGTVGATWFTYANGLQVQVAKVGEYTLPGQKRNDGSYSTGVLVTVALKNDSAKAIDASWANVTLTYGPYDQAARPRYDEYKGDRLPGMFFSGKLAPGASSSTRFGFDVPVEYMTDLTATVRPAIKGQPAVFAGGLAARPTPTPTPAPPQTIFDE
jgi:hypothetical protein